MTIRIQRKRERGWKMPAGVVCVHRGTLWGNPWEVARVGAALRRAVTVGAIRSDAFWRAAFSDHAADGAFEKLALGEIPARAAVMLFEAAAESFRREDPAGFNAWIAPLIGRDLACWCPPDMPCHADVLLRLAHALAPGNWAAAVLAPLGGDDVGDDDNDPAWLLVENVPEFVNWGPVEARSGKPTATRRILRRLGRYHPPPRLHGGLAGAAPAAGAAKATRKTKRGAAS